MAKATNPMTLTVDWTAVGAAANTVLISQRKTNNGNAEILVAGAAESLSAADKGHTITPNDVPAISFYGLGTNVVYARKPSSDATVILDVTRY